MNEVPNPDKFTWKAGDIEIIKLPDKKPKEEQQKPDNKK